MTVAYTLVIGTENWSSWSLRPYLALAAAGAPFDLARVRLRQPGSQAAILEHSPSGKVPALHVRGAGGDFTVWDSLAICETLAERHPSAGLWPSDVRIRASARSLSAEMHSGFADVRDQLSMDFGVSRPLPELREATVAQIARIKEALAAALAAHGKEGGFLFGRFCIADCMYAPVVSRFITYGVDMPPRLSDYAARIMDLPAMKAWGDMAARNRNDGIVQD